MQKITENVTAILDNFRLRGVKGTTGTQASFKELFSGDYKKVKELDKLVCNKMGFEKTFAVSGQTYTRKFDFELLSVLAGIAESAMKFANDIRLLQSMKEIEEPFEATPDWQFRNGVQAQSHAYRAYDGVVALRYVAADKHRNDCRHAMARTLA